MGEKASRNLAKSKLKTGRYTFNHYNRLGLPIRFIHVKIGFKYPY